MKYSLTITKTEPNPNYTEELKAWNERSTWNRPYDMPRPEESHTVKSLEAELTPEEFVDFKAAALKNFS